MENKLQGTPEWLEAKNGKFSASKWWMLTKKGKTKDKPFGDTAISYIFEVIAEINTNGLSREELYSKAIEWGKMYEPEAKRVYSEFTGSKIVDCGFIEGDYNTGASPDGLIGDDGLIETKCPNSSTHLRHLLLKTAHDLLEYNEKYYYQVMCQLWVTGRKWCDFVSYDPRATERTCLSILRINRDEEVISLMKNRAILAENYMNELIQKIINRNQ